MLELKFDIFLSHRSFGRDVRMFRQFADKRWLAQPIVWKEIKKGELAEPTFNIGSDGEAQGLMDAMWNSGIRPSSGEGNVGMIGAMKDHIEDLRKTVAFTLELHADICRNDGKIHRPTGLRRESNANATTP